eukprot:586738-Hanusia_phi.AAC.1
MATLDTDGSTASFKDACDRFMVSQSDETFQAVYQVDFLLESVDPNIRRALALWSPDANGKEDAAAETLPRDWHKGVENLVRTVPGGGNDDLRITSKETATETLQNQGVVLPPREPIMTLNGAEEQRIEILEARKKAFELSSLLAHESHEFQRVSEQLTHLKLTSRKKHRKLQEEVDVLKTQREKDNITITTLRAELDKLRKSHAIEIEDANFRIREVQRENEIDKGTLNAVRKENSKLLNQLQMKSKVETQYISEISKLKSALRHDERNLASLEIEIKRLQDENLKLKLRLNDQASDRDHTSRKLALMDELKEENLMLQDHVRSLREELDKQKYSHSWEKDDFFATSEHHISRLCSDLRLLNKDMADAFHKVEVEMEERSCTVQPFPPPSDESDSDSGREGFSFRRSTCASRECALRNKYLLWKLDAAMKQLNEQPSIRRVDGWDNSQDAAIASLQEEAMARRKELEFAQQVLQERQQALDEALRRKKDLEEILARRERDEAIRLEEICGEVDMLRRALEESNRASWEGIERAKNESRSLITVREERDELLTSIKHLQATLDVTEKSRLDDWERWRMMEASKNAEIKMLKQMVDSRSTADEAMTQMETRACQVMQKLDDSYAEVKDLTIELSSMKLMKEAAESARAESDKKIESLRLRIQELETMTSLQVDPELEGSHPVEAMLEASRNECRKLLHDNKVLLEDNKR